jgi:hypothetical protein
MEVDRGVSLAQVSLLCSSSFRAGLAHSFNFQGSAASGNPFTDSYAVSTLTDVAVNDLDRVEMSTYQDGDVGGRLWIFFTATTKAC